MWRPEFDIRPERVWFMVDRVAVAFLPVSVVRAVPSPMLHNLSKWQRGYIRHFSQFSVFAQIKSIAEDSYLLEDDIVVPSSSRLQPNLSILLGMLGPGTWRRHDSWKRRDPLTKGHGLVCQEIRILSKTAVSASNVVWTRLSSLFAVSRPLGSVHCFMNLEFVAKYQHYWAAYLGVDLRKSKELMAMDLREIKHGVLQFTVP